MLLKKYIDYLTVTWSDKETSSKLLDLSIDAAVDLERITARPVFEQVLRTGVISVRVDRIEQPRSPICFARKVLRLIFCRS